MSDALTRGLLGERPWSECAADFVWLKHEGIPKEEAEPSVASEKQASWFMPGKSEDEKIKAALDYARAQKKKGVKGYEYITPKDKKKLTKTAKVGKAGKAALVAAGLIGTGAAAGTAGHHFGKKTGLKEGTRRGGMLGLQIGRMAGLSRGRREGFQVGYLRGSARTAATGPKLKKKEQEKKAAADEKSKVKAPLVGGALGALGGAAAGDYAGKLVQGKRKFVQRAGPRLKGGYLGLGLGALGGAGLGYLASRKKKEQEKKAAIKETLKRLVDFKKSPVAQAWKKDFADMGKGVRVARRMLSKKSSIDPRILDGFSKEAVGVLPIAALGAVIGGGMGMASQVASLRKGATGETMGVMDARHALEKMDADPSSYIGKLRRLHGETAMGTARAAAKHPLAATAANTLAGAGLGALMFGSGAQFLGRK